MLSLSENSDTNKTRQFLTENHLQGYVSSKINLVLTHDSKIVAVMTFGKPRYTDKHTYEILRFCTDRAVIGAASKLFQHFIREYQPNSVISYSDNRWGDGSVYRTMGFTEQSTTIGYFYTDYKQRFNRQQFQKHKLVAEGFDASLTEWQIMQQRKFDRI